MLKGVVPTYGGIMSDNIHEILKARVQSQANRESSNRRATYTANRAKLDPLTAQAYELLRQTNFPQTGSFSDTVRFYFITERSKEDTAAWLLAGESDSGYGFSTHAHLTADGRLVYFDLKLIRGHPKIGGVVREPVFRRYTDFLDDRSENGAGTLVERYTELTVERLEKFIQQLTMLKNRQ